MRIIIDLQACQFLSRFRGIGRYSMLLAQSMASQLTKRDHEVWLLLNDKFPETIESITSCFYPWIPHNKIAVFSTPHSVESVNSENHWRIRAAEQIREHFIAQLEPDFVHVASLMEGWLDESVVSIGLSDINQATAVTLYDLIPLVLKDSYLTDPAYKEYYFRKIESMKRADILFAISENSRHEVVELLNFSPENVINISTAIDRKFIRTVYTQEERAEIFDRYKITKNFVLYVPGGFDPRKNFDRLLEAFSALPEPLINTYQLVLSSKLHGSEREFIETLATKYGLNSEQFVLTDYVSDDDLIALYNLCSLKVFPSLHEGFGLPALEAMACGAPVIGSNTTSIPEVIGRKDALFDPYSAESITNKIYEALTDEPFNRDLREHGLVQSKKFSWDGSAAAAVSALESKFGCQKLSDCRVFSSDVAKVTSLILRNISQAVDVDQPSLEDIRQLNNSITRNNFRVGQRQLLVDVSELVRSDAKTGIQRVVRSILLQLVKSPPADFKVVPIYSSEGLIFQYAHSFISEFLNVDFDTGADLPIEFSRGDVFLGLDLSAHLFPSLNSELKKMREYGVYINYVVYDLTPLTHAHWHVPGMNPAFKQWMSSLSYYADNLICISQSVAEDVKIWLMEHFPDQEKRIVRTYFHLGADISNSVPSVGMPHDADFVLNAMRSRPSFLAVGSIEPRKGYSQLLAAFELLWSENLDVNLIIVGKSGWHVDEITQRLISHPELSCHLFWLTGVSDEYLGKIYGAASCLIAASEAEGFGLPLIEAAQHKLPVIARDILVFREVAGKYAFYFDGMQDTDLSAAIKVWLKLFRENLHPASDDMPWLTWSQSAKQLKDKILGLNVSNVSLLGESTQFLKNRFIRVNSGLVQPVPAYELGTEVDFSTKGTARIYTRDGWSHSEDWGCWTASKTATLDLRVIAYKRMPFSLRLLVKSFVSGRYPRQKLDIFVNNTLVDEFFLYADKNHNDLHEVSIEIPIDMISDSGELKLQFSTPDSESPLTLGMSPDNRLLGVGIASMRLLQE
nr:glycosyltransferase family 1 protein [uncultured Albidiferax sp.]